MQCLLEILHFCLNPSKSKKSPDDSCSNRCLIHKNVYLNSYFLKSCECSSLKESKQVQHSNNLMHFVYAHEVLIHCEQVLQLRGKDITYLQNCLTEMLTLMRDVSKKSDQCFHGNKNCVYKTTRTKLVIEEPLPQVFMMSISWFGKDLTYLETFNFAVSIPRVLKIEDIFADNGEGQV